MKSIYQPKGKANDYSPWACNLNNDCPHNRVYCYNDHSIMSVNVGGTTVRLKNQLVDETTAYKIFQSELLKYKEQIKADGALHFNFVSDPCLPETIVLNAMCIDYAISQGVPYQNLTKRADWSNHPSVQNVLPCKDMINVGFSLTGCDDMEPGASTNEQRIWALQVLHDAGVPTWASIEPIIDPHKSYYVIARSQYCCDHYKIGVLSGKKSYTPQQIRDFIMAVNALGLKSVYWKMSLIEFIKKA
ncbi:MAG: hypothetical protein ACI4TD_02735 [Phocaeicola sp.]